MLLNKHYVNPLNFICFNFDVFNLQITKSVLQYYKCCSHIMVTFFHVFWYSRKLIQIIQANIFF